MLAEDGEVVAVVEAILLHGLHCERDFNADCGAGVILQLDAGFPERPNP